MATYSDWGNIDIQAFRDGDPRAFQLIYKKYYKLVLWVCNDILKVKEDAEEVVGDTFQELDIEKKKFDNELYIRNFLCTVARNNSINLLKKRTGSSLIFSITDPHKLESIYLPDELTVQITDSELIRQILFESEKLSSRNREIFQYYYLEEKSVDEIVEIMGISKKKIYYRLASSKQNIRNMLKNKGFRIFILLFWLCWMLS